MFKWQKFCIIVLLCWVQVYRCLSRCVPERLVYELHEKDTILYEWVEKKNTLHVATCCPRASTVFLMNTLAMPPRICDAPNHIFWVFWHLYQISSCYAKHALPPNFHDFWFLPPQAQTSCTCSGSYLIAVSIHKCMLCVFLRGGTRADCWYCVLTGSVMLSMNYFFSTGSRWVYIEYTGHIS